MISIYRKTSVAGNSGDEAAGVSSYRDGYSDCAREVATYLGRLDTPGGVLVRTRVLAHLSARLRAVNSAHRHQKAPPTSHRLPVSSCEDRCRVTTSFQAPAAAASSTSDGRLAAPSATGTCQSADIQSHSPDGACGLLDRPSTPTDEKHHVTTTTATYDVNGNDVTTQPTATFDEEPDASLVWRPW